jgi:hypothetical protein
VVTPREERLAKNEALFRGVNERVRDVKGDAADPEERIRFVCECGRETCLEEVELTVAEYEATRSVSTQFVVKPGHELADVERVLTENARYSVVEKHEEEAAVARRTDPREGR